MKKMIILEDKEREQDFFIRIDEIRSIEYNDPIALGVERGYTKTTIYRKNNTYLLGIPKGFNLKERLDPFLESDKNVLRISVRDSNSTEAHVLDWIDIAKGK